MSDARIPGYTYGTPAAAHSPYGAHDLDLLLQCVLFTEEDARHLRAAGEVLADQIEQVLDVWYGFVGGHPHLLHYFSAPNGAPHAEYLAAVRLRFGQWIRDTCRATFDQAWLDYQEEMALRHTRAKKNRTDGVRSAADHIPLRYVIAFLYPLTATLRPFLAARGHSEAEVEKLHQAWFKALVLQVALWSEAYFRPEALPAAAPHPLPIEQLRA